jgi:hypothetical protein
MRVSKSLPFVGLLFVLAGCSASNESPSSPYGGIGDGKRIGTPSTGGGDGSPTATPSVGGGASDTSSGSSGSGSASTGAGQGTVSAGTLTAGAWDDNLDFDLFLPYLQSTATLEGVVPLTEQEARDANATWSLSRAPHLKLDVSLIVDTTGSMGDEITYLNAEFLNIHAAIEAQYPGAEQRWSLVAYKDTCDPVLVEWYDFRSDATDFVARLKTQTASGGGDYPESPEQALDVASKLAWRGDDTAKLAFWVSDAPHHPQNAGAMATAIRALRGRGVHLYPVAASGADELTMRSMRQGAQYTGGRFLFLTDDSGVGGSHATPTVPCFFVTKLDAAIRRMVDVEMTGTYREPTASELLRTGGDPTSGRCTLSDGQTAVVF